MVFLGCQAVRGRGHAADRAGRALYSGGGQVNRRDVHVFTGSSLRLVCAGNTAMRLVRVGDWNVVLQGCLAHEESTTFLHQLYGLWCTRSVSGGTDARQALGGLGHSPGRAGRLLPGCGGQVICTCVSLALSCVGHNAACACRLNATDLRASRSFLIWMEAEDTRQAEQAVHSPVAAAKSTAVMYMFVSAWRMMRGVRVSALKRGLEVEDTFQAEQAVHATVVAPK